MRSSSAPRRSRSSRSHRGASYLVKYALQLRNYFQAVQGSRTYRTCVVAASTDYRTAIELASLGV
ncbi:hypothetical protein [Streptomyces morookaense]|uniref:Uncharacterized protein n=1 Tax=Streptomyces morookaense TaxID=1970 RepID=A0A7Y7EAM0_STRMO|nr:hypothetical protein [Streptomyces morookaense]NVK81659.1 hypothetical protein [Streptomyces morookaense]